MRALVLGLCALLGCAHVEDARAPSVTRDAVVVLGHRPARDEQGIEPETRARVLGGVRLYREGRAPRLAFAGGRTAPGESEAEVMGALARELGVPAQALRLEKQSQDTMENARFTVALLEKELGRRPELLLVTSDYHMARAARLFRCAGAVVESAPVELTGLSAFQRMSRRMRERAVRVSYWFFDECARVRG